MRDVTVFTLVSFGLTTLITRSSVVAWAVRRVGLARWPLVVTGIRCAQCVGFWVGLGLSLSGFSGFIAPSSTPLDAVFSGFVASGSSWFLSTLANPYQEADHD